METERHFLLLRGIKSLLRCDNAEVVSGIARYVISQYGSLRLLSWLIERMTKTPFPAAVALFGGLVSFLEVRPAGAQEGVVWIARLGQERRAIKAIIETSPSVPELPWTELCFRRRPYVAALSSPAVAIRIGLTGIRRIFRIARRMHRRFEFFKVLRVVELVACYARYLSIFQNGRFAVAITSNHSNPHGIAFNLAARKCGVPVVLISHGMPVRPVAKLAYDLALVHCEAARHTYLEEGCELKRVLVHGRQKDHKSMPAGPLPARLAVGIFLCKDVNERRLREVAENLLGNSRVSSVLVRPHPTNLWLGLDAWIASRNDKRLRRSSGTSVSADLAESDIVLAGNSSVLVEAVTAGRPSGYVPGLDHGSPDLHKFVATGLIYANTEELARKRDDGFGRQCDYPDFEEIIRFYQRPDWLSVLRLFADIDEDGAAVTAQARIAIRELAGKEIKQHFPSAITSPEGTECL
jgi:hypothetical protein